MVICVSDITFNIIIIVILVRMSVMYVCSYFRRMAIVLLSFSPKDFVMNQSFEKETINVISPPLEKIISENTFNQSTEK